jgi:phage tail-like protein
MSTREIRRYRFATAAQWRHCLLHGFDAGSSGILATRPLGRTPTLLGGAEPVSLVAVDTGGRPVWRSSAPAASLHLVDDDGEHVGPVDADPAILGASRWVIDRSWLWAASPAGKVIGRFHGETLERDLVVDAGRLASKHAPDATEPNVVDITGDGHDGLWVLLRWPDDGLGILHVDCRGADRGFFKLPCAAAGAVRVGSLERGRKLVLLLAERPALVSISTENRSVTSTVALGNLYPGFSALAMATNGRDRIALVERHAAPLARRRLLVLDAHGDLLEALEAPASGEPGAPDASDARFDVAVGRDAVWLATPRGLFRFHASHPSAARESDSSFVTQVLTSLPSDTARGFLRAELDLDLPTGAVLEAQVASTDDGEVARQAEAIRTSPATTVAQRQEGIWALFDPATVRHFTVTGPRSAAEPVSIPLFQTSDRFLWLRIRVVTPPGTASGAVRELVVLYPNQTLARQLPAIFNDERTDAAGFMRRFVGVLETTTQRLDEKITRIGSYLDPKKTPEPWLDYLARWVDLPWDDALPPSAKRRLLTSAGPILDHRGTRTGLLALFRALLGEAGRARVTDLTVDHPPLRLGGRGRPAARLPALLAGASARVLVIGGKARLGQGRLACNPDAADPLGEIRPTLVIELRAAPVTKNELAPVLRAILAQYVPLDVKVDLRWVVTQPALLAESDETWVLDGRGPGSLGKSSVLGRVVVEGRGGSRIGEDGFEMGARLE